METEMRSNGWKEVSQSSEMAPLRRFRLCRSRIGSIFFVVLACALTLFAINYISSSSPKLIDEEQSGTIEHELSELGGEWNLRRKPVRTNNHNKLVWEDKEDDGPVQICRVPHLTLENDANKFAFHAMPKLNCSGHEHLFYLKDQILHLNKTVLKGRNLASCEYRAIEWMTDSYHTYTDSLNKDKAPWEIKVHHDFIHVTCSLEDMKENSESNKQVEDAGGNLRRLLEFNEVNVNNVGQGQERNNAVNMLGSMGMPDPPVIQSIQGEGHNMRNAQAEQPPVNIKKNTQQETMNDKTLEELGDNKPMEQDENAKELEQNEDYNRYHDEQMQYYVENEADFDQILIQLEEKKEVFDRIKDLKPHDFGSRMNVLIFTLDSMSHLSYQRKLPKTYRYIQDVLGTTVMHTYNIVGDATTAAIIPITTGKTEMELPETRKGKPGSTYVDAYPLIWNKFEQQGYVTLFAEDQPDWGTFNLRLNGFEQQPVDHYMRPFWQAVEASDLYKNSESHCVGAKPKHYYTLKYMKEFMEKYKDIPKFCWGFMGSYSHDDNNPSEYVDSDLVAFLEQLRVGNLLQNTVVVIMGDHGARYSKVRSTTQGKLEERLPMMSLAFPQSFKEKYPDLMKNLQINANRLSTPFDFHETLKDIIDLRRTQTKVKYSDRGISLLREIPMNRTCLSAGIDMHWCTCMKWKEMSPQDPRAKSAANLILDYINQLTEKQRHLCHKLQLKEISDIRVVYPNEKVLTYISSIDGDQRIANFSSAEEVHLDIIHYQLILETSPNDALFEATVQVDMKDKKMHITPEISRINVYGSQPSCVIEKFPDLRKYCYCHKKPGSIKPRPKSRKTHTN